MAPRSLVHGWEAISRNMRAIGTVLCQTAQSLFGPFRWVQPQDVRVGRVCFLLPFAMRAERLASGSDGSARSTAISSVQAWS
jgi:hypothetical protein